MPQVTFTPNLRRHLDMPPLKVGGETGAAVFEQVFAAQPGIHSICVDPRDSRRITLAISCGGGWQTGDGGESWRQRGDGLHAAYMPAERARDPNNQDPHRVVSCPAAPDTFWMQHHTGIFRSTDSARTWREVSPTSPPRYGFPVVVHPQEHAYHLVYRHALDIDASGEVLAMGSTTGGLWVSENGGEQWRAVALHLPPIYAVRFG